MTKAQLVRFAAAEAGVSQAETGRVLDALVQGIVWAVTCEEGVRIPGLGIFERATRKSRTVRNPQTGEAIQLPERCVPRFRAAQAFKDKTVGA